MTWARRILILLPAILFVVAWPTFREPLSTADAIAAVTDAVTGWILIVAGIVAAERRPGARSGPLLIAAGYLWYVGDLYFVFPDASILPLLSFAFRGYYDLIFAFLLLSFPTGHLETKTQRVAVIAMVAVYVARSVAFLALGEPGRAYPDNGISNPFLLASRGPLREVDGWLLALEAIAIAAIAILAIVRWRLATPPTRRVLTPVLIGGLAWAATSVLYKLGPLADILFNARIPPWEDADWWAIPDYLLRGSAAPIGFLVAALMLRTARAAVVDLVSGIGDQPARQQLEQSLIRVLGDPGLTVIYPSGDGWVDGQGRPTETGSAVETRAATQIESGGRVVATILHDPALLEDPGLVGAVAATARLAIDNERLSTELEAQLAEVRASRIRIVEGADAERRRIERDLHDGAQQRLVAIAMSLRMLSDSIGPDASSDVVREIDAASAELRAAIDELRELARGLDPPLLRESGLTVAIEALAERMHVPVKLELSVTGRLPRSVETTAYFVVAEALANVAKHARARELQIRAWLADGKLNVEVVDDGKGGADPASGSGLRGLADRVAAIGGTLEVADTTSGGTRLKAEMPCA